MTIEQKQALLLTALVEDLCEESSAEEVFERLIAVGENFGITEDDILANRNCGDHFRVFVGIFAKSNALIAFGIDVSLAICLCSRCVFCFGDCFRVGLGDGNLRYAVSSGGSVKLVLAHKNLLS